MVTRAALVTILLLGAQVVATSLASAHVPEVCKPLFLEAGKATEGVVRKGNEANVDDGLNPRLFAFLGARDFGGGVVDGFMFPMN